MFEENGMFDKFALAVWQKVTGIDTTCLNWPRIESDWGKSLLNLFGIKDYQGFFKAFFQLSNNFPSVTVKMQKVTCVN